jgi:hypothetical protein
MKWIFTKSSDKKKSYNSGGKPPSYEAIGEWEKEMENNESQGTG